MTFDLDPGPGVEWSAVCAGALRVRERLAELGLQSFREDLRRQRAAYRRAVAAEDRWDELKAFARAVADDLVPRRAAALRCEHEQGRGDRARSSSTTCATGAAPTSVAAYSSRARAQAPVSAPVRWDEVNESLRPDTYTVSNLPRRLAALKVDPWAEYFQARQSITAAMLKAVGLKR